MIPLVQLTGFVGGTAVALVASNVLIVRLERLGARLGITEAALGLVAALAADGPEITSAGTALASGRHDIGIGVVLGSNVFNLAALLGLGAVVAGRITLHRRVVLLEGLVACWLALVAMATVTKLVSPILGLVLAGTIFLPYVLANALPARLRLRLPIPRGPRVDLTETIAEAEEELAEAIHPEPGGAKDAWVAAGALLVVVGAAVLMETTGSALGTRWHLSDVVVGGVILAAVTSLPNAVAAIYLARRGRGAATLSEAFNSNAINTVVGFLLPAAFVGLGTLTSGSISVARWYVGATVAVVVAAWLARGIRNWVGGLIIVGYAAFVMTLVS